MWRKIVQYLSITTLCLTAISLSAEAQHDQYQLKTVLLYKLSKFVTWPDIHNRRIYLCHYDTSPFSKALLELDKKRIEQYSFQVRRIKNLSDNLTQCNILLIPQSASTQLPRALAAASHHSILTISDIENFALSGGMIELAQKNRRIHFKINLQALKRSKIRLHSSLLELATIVDGSEHD